MTGTSLRAVPMAASTSRIFSRDTTSPTPNGLDIAAHSISSTVLGLLSTAPKAEPRAQCSSIPKEVLATNAFMRIVLTGTGGSTGSSTSQAATTVSKTINKEADVFRSPFTCTQKGQLSMLCL